MRIRLTLAAATALATSAAAQDRPSAPESSEIVVEGSRDRDRQIRQFVDALTDAPIGGQLSRFNWAVCPAAVGLPEAQNRAVAARMRLVAKAAGIRTGAADCRANALVIVTSDKAKLISALRRAYPAYFADAFGSPIRISRQPGPVTAWHVEGIVDSNGLKPAVNLIPKYTIVSSNDSSRLLPSTTPYFAAGILVVERGALAGLTTTQLADYAAMRIFARTDPERVKASKAPTILTVIEAPMETATPITLTDWDLGFLRALYSSGERKYANHQRYEIQQRLRAELQEPRAPKR